MIVGMCLSGSLSIANYVKALTDAGFGTVKLELENHIVF
jgi:hypothetical protein